MTAPPHRRVVQASQTFLAAACVAAISVPALSVVQLEIVPPVTERTTLPTVPQSSPGEVSVVSKAPVRPTVEEIEISGQRGGPRASASDDGAPSSRTGDEARPGAARSGEPTTAGRYAVLTRPVPVTGFATVGVTWAHGQSWSEDDLTVSLRTLDRGRWSRWQVMHYDPAHTPDPGSQRAERTARPGTDAVVVGDVDKVQVRARTSTGEAPHDLELSVIDPGREHGLERTTAPATTQVAAAAAAAGSESDGGAAAQLAAAPTRPVIHTRKEWGAVESMRDGSPRYGTIHAGFVHHTVNANGYSREEVPRIIRGIYAYHTQSRGWSDVGYNFLVDRFGQIWEGRYGGIARPVIGAHTLGYNEYSFAMSAIGNFDVAAPPQAVIDAYARLFAWKLSLHGVKAGATRVKVGRSYFHAISGHRDAGQTACPGRYLYAKLPAIRTAAVRIQGGSAPPPPPPPPPPTPTAPATNPDTDLSGTDWPDIAVRRGDGRLMVTRTEGQMRFQSSVTGATGWAGKDLVAAPGDITADGRGDLIARDPDAGKASLFPGDGDGGFTAATRHYTRFNSLDQLVGVGDFDGNGRPDLVGRVRKTGALRLYPGLGRGEFDSARTLATSWRYDLTVGPGDLDGDKVPDLLARSGDTLYFLKGGRSRVAAPVALPGRWSGYDVVAGRGDLTRDGRPDVVARDSASKQTFVYPGNGKGAFGKRYGPFIGFRAMRWFAIGGPLKAGAGVDVVGIHGSTGTVKVFGHTGRTNVGSTVSTGRTLPTVAALLAVGDWNRDGHGDLMYRAKGTGRLMFLAGKGKDTYAAPVSAGTGFGGVTGLVAAGDVTGDGRPDLLGEDSGGTVRVYPGNGRSGFGTSFSARSSSRAARAGTHDGVVQRRRDGTWWLWRLPTDGGALTGKQVAGRNDGYDWFLFLGDVDDNGVPDVLARARKTGWLWLLPVTPHGLGERRYVGDELKGSGAAG